VLVKPAAFLELVASMDLDGDGLVSLEEFKKAFHDQELEYLIRGPSGDFEPVRALASPDHVPADMRCSSGGAGPGQGEVFSDPLLGLAANVAVGALKAFEVKLGALGSLDRVWDSTGTMQKRNKVSIWASSGGLGTLVARNKRQICVGHYAHGGLGNAPDSGSAGEKKMVLEVQDMSVWGISASPNLAAVVTFCFPHPARFHLVWASLGGRAKVYCWEPVPPSAAFVALGMICTDSDAPPPLEAVHCVPKVLTVEVETAALPEGHKRAPVALWDDCGLSARPVTCFVLGLAQLLRVCPGSTPPTRYRDWRSKKAFRLDLGELLESVPGKDAQTER